MSSLGELRELQEAAFEAPIDEGEFEYCVLLDDATSIVAALAAERERLREALEAVTQQLEHSFTPWPDATIDALRLARATLAPGTPVDVE